MSELDPEKRPFADAAIAQFLSAAAAKTPVPGGGGVAALSAAAAAAMAEMALAFTAGPKFAAVELRAAELKEAISRERLKLADLMTADARAYGAFSAAAKMPRETPARKSARSKAMNEASRAALLPPLEIVRSVMRVAPLLPEVLRICNPNLRSDAAVAAAILPGAARSGALNVWANIRALDAGEAQVVAREVKVALAAIEKAGRVVYREVERELCPKTTGRS